MKPLIITLLMSFSPFAYAEKKVPSSSAHAAKHIKAPHHKCDKKQKHCK